MSLTDKHIFAIYVPTFFQTIYKAGSEVKVVEQEIVHRFTKVLRIESGEQIIFFDRQYHAIIKVLELSKKFFTVQIIMLEKNSSVPLEIKFFLPLLKKEALEEAVYSLAEIGVSNIQLVVTQKSRQKLLHEKEFIRLESIIVAAAEQSKNYIFPKLHMPISITDITSDTDSSRVVFDPEGESFFDIRLGLSEEKISLMVGPEGGLTHEELMQLEKLSFKKCRLTSTILRAVQAVALGAGLFKL